ncbi:hypothetical protein QTP88_013211 [Uroleucon formosanum]
MKLTILGIVLTINYSYLDYSSTHTILNEFENAQLRIKATHLKVYIDKLFIAIYLVFLEYRNEHLYLFCDILFIA